MESAGRSLTLALVLEAATHAPLRNTMLAAFRRLAARPYSALAPVGTEAIALADTETELLRAGYQPPGSE